MTKHYVLAYSDHNNALLRDGEELVLAVAYSSGEEDLKPVEEVFQQAEASSGVSFWYELTDTWVSCFETLNRTVVVTEDH